MAFSDICGHADRMSAIPGIYKSLIRHTQDLIDHIRATTGNQAIEYHDWESRSDANTLPRTTLLGLNGFTFSENAGLWVIRYALSLSSFQDANLLNEIEMIGIIHDATGQGSKIRLLDPSAGTEISELLVSDWELSPMMQTELRNERSIMLELRRTSND